MIRNLTHLLLLVALLALAACATEEEATPTTVPPTETPVPPTATPEPTMTPTEIPPTNTPEPTATSEPEPAEAEAAVSPLGYWKGAIATSGIELLINIDFAEGDGGLAGTIDIPQQGAMGLLLENISLDGDQIHFEIAGVGAQFDGIVTEDAIAGDFKQGDATGTFDLATAERVVEEASADEADLPYRVEEISWEIDDTTVGATLTIPEGEGPFPAFVLIAGSGPTDRDWNSPLLPGTNGSAALFADALTRAGFVTLRYDKRVSGPNAAENVEKMIGELSLQSHLDEVTSAVDLLANHELVDASRILALANSEGAIHALNYQREAADFPFAGIILAAPPGRPFMDLMRAQIEAQLTGLPDFEAIMALFDEGLERFQAGEPIDPSPDLPEGLQQLLLSLEVPANLPFTREINVVDPAAWLGEIEVPVLVLIGQKDIQIDWQVDGPLLEEAVAGGENVTFVYPENANHVFKFEEKPADQLTANDAGLYNSGDRVLDEDTLLAIFSWLANQ